MSASEPRDCCTRYQNEMSYIHDALKKAQKEKGTRSKKYQGIVPAGLERQKLLPGKALWVIPVFLGVVALAAYLWLAPADKKAPASNASGPEVKAAPETAPKGRETPQAKPALRTRAAGKPKVPVKETPRPAAKKTPVPRVNRENEAIQKPEVIGRADPAPPPARGVKGTTARVREGLNKHSPEPVTLPEPETTPQPPAVLEPGALYEKARSFHKGGQWQEAKAMYEETLSRDPKHVYALNNMGVLFIRDKDYPAAREAFSEAVRLKPDYVDAYYNLACVYALEGRLSESLVHLRKSVSLDASVKAWARQDTDLANLRGVPDFEKIVRKQGALD